MSKLALTEKRNPDTVNIDLMDSYQIAQAINNEDKKVAPAVETQLRPIGEAIEAIARAFLKGGRLAYFGAGTSGRLGVLDASECWPTFGVEHGMVCGYIAGGDKALRFSVENAEDSAELAEQDLTAFNPSPDDIVVGISAGGGPRYVLTVLEQARKKGCTTIGISSNPDALLQKFSDIFINPTIGISSNPDALLQKFSDIFINPVVGEEVITGSSRMKSGTAQKMILNMLSTGAMIRIGKVYQNYMIDLRLVNAKLIDRGRRFVSEIAGVSYDEAAELLNTAGNNVKTACVMGSKKCGKTAAEKLLKANNGILRKII